MAWVKGEAPIVIFNGGDDGGLYARNVGLNTYHHTMNWDCRPKGTSVPAMAPLLISDSDASAFCTRVESAISWRETDGTPYVLGFGSARIPTRMAVGKLKNGAWDADFKEVLGDDRFLRAVKYRNDGTGGTGVDAEVIWGCNGSANDNIYELLKDGTFRRSSHTQKFDGLAVVGSDLWGWAGYKIQKNTTDSDPGLSGSWQSAIPVGIPSYDINEVIPLGNSPIVLKGDGAFVFDPQTSEFQNLTPSISSHEDNGRGGFTDGRGRVYFPTIDGDLIVITFGFQSSQKPTSITTIDRDTPLGRIGRMTADLEHVYAVTDPGFRLTQDGVGLFIQEDNGSVFNDQTTDLTDRSAATTDENSGDWSLLGSGDFVYIGADVPFAAFHLEILTANTGSSVLLPTSVEYSTGTSTFSSSSPVLFDGTSQLTRAGLIVFADDDITASTFATPWTKGTVNSVEKYWIRLAPAAALTGLTVSEVKVAPFRPPLDAAVHSISGQIMAGVMPKVLVGTWQGEDLKWDDVWTLEAPIINSIAVSDALYTQGSGRRSLMCFSDVASSSDAIGTVHAIPIGSDNSPLVQPFPKLADYSESGTAFDEHAIWFSGHDSFVHSRNLKRVLEGTVVDFPGVQSDDDVYLYHWWDADAARVYKAQIKGSHAVLPRLEGTGRVLYMALQFVDGSRDEVAPQLLSVEIPNWEWDDDPAAVPPRKEDQAAPLQR